MTVELVTGFADTPHVDAADDGALNAAVISDRNHVLGTPSPAVMRDSNHLTVPTMEALFMGRHVRVTSAEDVTIASGSQGSKRHDIVGFRYSRNSSTNVETVVLDVIRGTASSTPADPALPTGNILTGASSAFMPLYRVPLDGITVGTPVPLFNVLRPMSELWTSADQIPGIKSQISGLQASANQLPGIKSQISNLQASVTQSYPDKTQTWDGWNISTQYAGVNLRHISAEKKYGSATNRFDSNIEIDLPFSVRYAQRIPCYGMVANTIVSYGVMYILGRRMHLSFNGYGNGVTVIADGLVYVS